MYIFSSQQIKWNWWVIFKSLILYNHCLINYQKDYITDLIWSVGLFLDKIFLIVSKHELLVVRNMSNNKATRVTRNKTLKPQYPFKPLVSTCLLEIASQGWSFNDYLRVISVLVA